MFRASVKRAVRPWQNVRSLYGAQPSGKAPLLPNTFAYKYYSSSPTEKNNLDSTITPWYVSEAIKTAGSDARENSIELPRLPDNSPESLAKVIEFAVKDMGLKDVVVIDKRGEGELEVSSALGPALIVLGTGTGSKHLGSAGALLRTWLKTEFGIHADREGILTTNFVKLHNRRQRRRQQRHRTAKEDTQLQRVGSWIAVDTKLDNIYVHVMTSDRRSEVDLENLGDWIEDSEIDRTEMLRLEEAYVDLGVGVTITSPASHSKNRRSYSTQTRSPGVATQLPSSREELALHNLAADKREDLTEDSPEVKSFVNHFPKRASRADWKHRLNFFALATVQSPIFSPEKLLEEAQFQQASGYVLDAEDIETVVSAICYHGQSHFATLSRDDESMAAWSEFCDTKAELLVRLYDFALRPLGRSLITNPRLLTLLYRTFVGMSSSSTTPARALEGAPVDEASVEVFSDVSRSVPLRYLLETTGEMRNLQTVSMMLTSLCSKDSFDAFWKTCNASILAAATAEYSENVIELALSLAVQSGDRSQINYAIRSFLPNFIMTGEIRLTPTMVKAMSAGLEIVDSNRHGNYESVRKIIAQYENESPQPQPT